MNKGLLSFAFLLVILISSSCKKDDFTTDPSAMLAFSDDTLMFDTVFTTVGSSTEYLIIYNNNDQAINISSIRLAGGDASNFRLNVDGMPGRSFENVTIEANDSLWLFAEVTVDPNNQNTPLVIADSILFVTNGNLQDVDLVAWGQDAYFHRPPPHAPPLFFLDSNDIWNNDKPHVIYGYALVETGTTLTINAGTQVHFHSGSGLIVMSGASLDVNGSFSDPVIFQGDRLGVEYSEVPGQWNYIRLSNITLQNLQGNPDDIGPGVLSCTMDWAVIKNGNVGVVADTMFNPTATTLTMNNCIVENMSGAALLGRGARILASNSVFANCGLYLTQLVYGGEYDFLQCTFANFWQNGNRQTPSLLLNNYYVDLRPIDAYFGNCIIYGNLENEIKYDSANTPVPNSFSFLFDHCLLKIDPDISTSNPSNYLNILKNIDPLFEDEDANNYELDSTSIAIDAGNTSLPGAFPWLQQDLKQAVRPQGPAPDMGAYERR